MGQDKQNEKKQVINLTSGQIQIDNDALVMVIDKSPFLISFLYPISINFETISEVHFLRFSFFTEFVINFIPANPQNKAEMSIDAVTKIVILNFLMNYPKQELPA